MNGEQIKIIITFMMTWKNIRMHGAMLYGAGEVRVKPTAAYAMLTRRAFQSVI